MLDELNYQFLCRLKKEGLITLKESFIDGTKIEANANRDTLSGEEPSTSSLPVKYALGDAPMFIIDGMEKVLRVIEENRKRKLTRHKKISNNSIIEIDNCSSLEIVRLQKSRLMRTSRVKKGY